MSVILHAVKTEDVRKERDIYRQLYSNDYCMNDAWSLMTELYPIPTVGLLLIYDVAMYFGSLL